ncbi:branched-chain amino acid ABC transporter permease [Variovorax sp. WS11]|uniref:branched-chain amino acid ABC transporter permease n=1 Tax=Variovorax sp. WS11 TaxID=1105204 RepID=UPI000D0D04E0|nr:branched-chain amino acid ABC transporter permease [Variovorax sp. WS11]NDZ17585.1 branched-chain amino acid ABC transporter permease [Variovorax sp. WS11]PSL82210.1 branched-chain amino acid ABC transporter permease [Variovorax sp. WS11]
MELQQAGSDFTVDAGRSWAAPLRRNGGWIAAAALLALAPVFIGGYELFLLCSIVSMAIALLGMNVLIGHCGIISLGHGALFALGAYAATLSLTRLGVPLLLVPLVAGLVCFVFGRLFAVAALKLEGMPLALATLGLAIVMPQLLRSDLLARWTGGVQGVSFTRPPVFRGVPLGDDAWLYLVTLSYLVVAFVLVHRLLEGGTGRAWRALRDQPLAATAMGVPARRMRDLAFAISAMLTGIGGALAAMQVQYVAPDSFPFALSLALFIGVVVGGPGSRIGPLLGAAFLVLIPNFAEHVSQAMTGAIYGGVVIALMALEKRGLAGVFERIQGLIFRAVRRRAPDRASSHLQPGDKA